MPFVSWPFVWRLACALWFFAGLLDLRDTGGIIPFPDFVRSLASLDLPDACFPQEFGRLHAWLGELRRNAMLDLAYVVFQNRRHAIFQVPGFGSTSDSAGVVACGSAWFVAAFQKG